MFDKPMARTIPALIRLVVDADTRATREGAAARGRFCAEQRP
jgi:hypothetical protein